jgi:hypothetical protein
MSEKLDTIQNRISDMLAVVRHVQEAVDRHKTDSRVVRVESAHALLQKISLALNMHAGELRRMLASRGALNGGDGDVVDSTISTVKEVVSSTLGQAAGIIGMARSDRVSLMLRDDYTAMNMVAIAYTMLHTTAVVLHDEAVASLAVNHLHDITPLIIETNEIVPRVVAMELLDDAEQIDLAAVDQAIINTQAAWNQEHVHMGHEHTWEAPMPLDGAGQATIPSGESLEETSPFDEPWNAGTPPVEPDSEA